MAPRSCFHILLGLLIGGCALPGGVPPADYPADVLDLGASWESAFAPAWFTKTFPLPARWSGKVVWLTLKAPNEPMDVWLNGDYLGFSEGGLFEAMVHPSLQRGVNTLSLRSVEPLAGMEVMGPAVRTATVWAPVSLRASEVVSLVSVKALPQAHALEERAEVSLTLDLVHPSANIRDLEVQVAVRPGNFHSAAAVHRTFVWSVGPGASQRTLRLPLDHPAFHWPWDFHREHEFVAQVEVMAEGRLLDARRQRFSFPSVRYNPMTRGWMINGKKIHAKPRDLRASGAFDPKTKAPEDLGR